MGRAGAEAKPAWDKVPRAVRRRVEALLGAPVQRATRIWGGYAPSATFRLALAGGRRVFFKGTYALAPGSPVHWVLDKEERAYRELGHLISPWAPAFYGSLKLEGWHALLLEDVGPSTLPPWTPARTRTVARAYAEFHRSTLGQPLPAWLPRRRLWGRFGASWDGMLEPAGAGAAGEGAAGAQAAAGGASATKLERLAALAGSREAEARQWLEEALPVLRASARQLTRARPPFALLHLDTRSDNIRLQGSRLRLFDWPFVCAGPPEVDAAAFAQSIDSEGGPAPEQFMAWYAEVLPVRDAVLDRWTAAFSGFFASHAWQQELPDLPRLRLVQRQQLTSSLPWAARRLGLPVPSWLEGVQR